MKFLDTCDVIYVNYKLYFCAIEKTDIYKIKGENLLN